MIMLREIEKTRQNMYLSLKLHKNLHSRKGKKHKNKMAGSEVGVRTVCDHVSTSL